MEQVIGKNVLFLRNLSTVRSTVVKEYASDIKEGECLHYPSSYNINVWHLDVSNYLLQLPIQSKAVFGQHQQ